MKQPRLGPERFAQSRALDAQSSGVGGVVAIAGDRRAACPSGVATMAAHAQ